jgi:NAD(P)-dependent dehydrogenase (short-subunit alcohol dehydrogenase family)/acyl carrier protein
VDVRQLFEGRAERVDMTALPVAAPGWRVNGHLVCTRDGEPVSGGLQPADRIPEVVMKHGGPSQAPAGIVGTSASSTARDANVLEYLRSVQQIVGAQREVMLSYLGDQPPLLAALDDDVPIDVAPTLFQGNGHGNGSNNGTNNGHHPIQPDLATLAPIVPDPVVDPVTSAPAEPVGAAVVEPVAESPAPSGDQLLELLLQVVADRTGYPLDMLDPDLDLEADLSIDSIKRIEVLGELADQVGLSVADESVVEELAQLKTLRAIVAWIDETHETATVVAVERPSTATASEAPSPAQLPPLPPTRRFLLETAMLAPALPVAPAAGKTLVLVSDPWEGLDELRRLLERAGASVEVVPTHRGAPHNPLPDSLAARLAVADGVVHLGAADALAPVDARDVFAALKPAICGQATTLVAAVAPRIRTAPTSVSGVPGLMRAIARELPDHHVRAIELASEQPASTVARLLADEILDPAGPVSVAYRDGTRTTRRVAKGTDLSSELPAVPFDNESVVVLTGGARGITSRAALAIAHDTQCRIELLGRSPLPGDEDLRTAAALDRPALRKALVDAGELRTPAAIEAACDRILADREIRATMAQLRALGSPTTYHSVDVRDGEALARALAEIRDYHGRIDAVVHGAGVLDDRFARDKTDTGFDQVFATKVDAARTLMANLHGDVRLVVFFGSVSGVFGNRGQVDYSAANDALDELAQRFDGVDGRRVVSIDWGPWGGTGMVGPELEREYARRGIGLIHPEDGIRALLHELGTLPGEPAQVVVMRAEPAAMEGRPQIAPGSWTPTDAELDELVDPDLGGGDLPAGDPVSGDPGSGLTLEDLTERG